MKKILFVLLVISLNVSAKTMDEIMAGVHGTCTSDACPPGTTVIIDVSAGDTGDAVDFKGKAYDLLQMKKQPLTVIKDEGSNDHISMAKVVTNGGAGYYIQWMFLKKK